MPRNSSVDQKLSSFFPWVKNLSFYFVIFTNLYSIILGSPILYGNKRMEKLL